MDQDTPRAADVVDREMVVTAQDLQENPVLAEAGVQEGDAGTEATPEQAVELDAKSTEGTAEEVAPAAEGSTSAEVASEQAAD